MSLRLTAGAIAIVLLVALVSAVTPNSSRVATATNSETDALIWHFNVYRVQNGAPPLYTHPGLSEDTQANAQTNADVCAIGYLTGRPSYAHDWKTWNTLGGTGDSVWDQYMNDPIYNGYIADPAYNSIGVGRAPPQATWCASGTIWSIAFASVDGAPPGANPTPTGPVTPTPVVVTLTPTATPTITSTAVTTPTPTNTPSGSASPTPYVPINGDADCNGQVLASDGMLLLFLAADIAANTPCLDRQGVDCTGFVDEFDVLALFRYLGGLDPGLPADCPPLGAAGGL